MITRHVQGISWRCPVLDCNPCSGQVVWDKRRLTESEQHFLCDSGCREQPEGGKQESLSSCDGDLP
jgi:hypothetical protein